MLAGIISDTHDSLDAIDEAVGMLNSKGVDLVIHGGDVISPFSVNRFKGLSCPIKAVFGNNDGERTGLKARFDELGTIIDDFIEFEEGGKWFAVYHGTIPSVLNFVLEGGKYDVVVSGHTHRFEVRKHGGTLFINPGEACGYLTGERTLCILDTEDMSTERLLY